MPMTPLVVADRLDLLDLLRDLTPEEWESPSLCAGWTVRDVVAHLLSYEGLTQVGVAARAVRAGFTRNRMNARGIRELDRYTPADLVRGLEEHLEPSGPPRRFGSRLGLTEGLIHQQDIRRPLSRPRQIPPERVRQSLSFTLSSPLLRGGWRTRGLALVAEDIHWTHGRGASVRGPGEAVLMAMAGRRDALGDLTGEGVPVLARRMP
jgi:uncharacterized protein (TIGR03083 family)